MPLIGLGLMLVVCVCVQVFGDEGNLYKLEDIQMQDFGQVGEVTVTKDDTLLMKVSAA